MFIQTLHKYYNTHRAIAYWDHTPLQHHCLTLLFYDLRDWVVDLFHIICYCNLFALSILQSFLNLQQHFFTHHLFIQGNCMLYFSWRILTTVSPRHKRYFLQHSILLISWSCHMLFNHHWDCLVLFQASQVPPLLVSSVKLFLTSSRCYLSTVTFILLIVDKLHFYRSTFLRLYFTATL